MFDDDDDDDRSTNVVEVSPVDQSEFFDNTVVWNGLRALPSVDVCILVSLVQ